MKLQTSLCKFLAVVYFSTQCLPARGVESPFWSDRRKYSEQFAALPAHLPPASSAEKILNGFSSVSLQNVAQSHLQRKWSQELSPADMKRLGDILSAIPGQYGSVREISIPRGAVSGPVVVHIQDVHLNEEAQNNIAAILKSLTDQKKAGLIALEGAFEPLNNAFEMHRPFF